MTFLTPVFLVIGIAAAAGIVLLHLITRDRPPQALLPTARFVPARVERAMTRAMRPADPLLLVVRVLLVLLAGAAFARPVLEPDRRAVARVVVLDRSRAVADPRPGLDSALALLAGGDALVVFDSAARTVAGAPRDTLEAMLADPAGGSRAPRGSLSAALLAARHASVQLRDVADSIELVLISPVAREELDAATAAIRAQWPGRMRIVEIAAAPVPEGAVEIDVRASASDPLVATATLAGSVTDTHVPVRVVRSPPSAGDSAFARDGAVLVVWPADSAPAGWQRRELVDTVGAVIGDSAVVIAPFERRYAAPAARERIVVRWVDGEPAAIERTLGAGCVREVGIPVDAAGDLALRPEMRVLLAVLAEPCGGLPRLGRIDDATRTLMAGSGPLAPAQVEDERSRPVPLVPWLLGAALLLALAEPLARRRAVA